MSSAFGHQDDNSTTKKAVTPFMGGRKPIDVLIVGGSHAGLFINILLKRQGHNVRVLERATSSARSGLAAGIGLANWVKRFFDENDRLKDVPLGVPNENVNVIDTDMNVKQLIPINYRMTSWEATYYRLRANNDGLKSAYVPQPPSNSPDEGEGIYKTGERVLRVEEGDSDKLSVYAINVETGREDKYEADVVIAADGANSTIRNQLHPTLPREYPGYVLWRGTVPTKSLSQETLNKLDGRTTLYPMRYSYTIIYSIPGEAGDLTPEGRLVNIAWYTWPSASNLTISQILTDKDGHTHHTTLPKGGMRPEIWSHQLKYAKTIMPPLLYELVSKITEPFASVVTTIHAPKAAYMDNRLFLIGDAQTQLQPNSGQGTNFAAMDAMLLARVFKGELSPEDWEARVVEASRREQAWAIKFASGWLCGWWGQGMAELRWRLVVVSQGLWEWWAGENPKAKL